MEQLYNLGVRERFMRQTNLPTNWLKVRLGIIASLTGAPGDNSAPVADSISNTLAPILHSSMLFGLADGTAGFPGDAGSGKFVGVKNYVAAGATLYVYYYPTASQWHIDVSGSGSGTSPGMIPLFTNGATLGQGTNVATGNVCTFGDPTAASGNVCFAWIIELERFHRQPAAHRASICGWVKPDRRSADECRDDGRPNLSVLPVFVWVRLGEGGRMGNGRDS